MEGLNFGTEYERERQELDQNEGMEREREWRERRLAGRNGGMQRLNVYRAGERERQGG